MQLLDLCILDIGSLSFKYSILAASAIYHCEDETTALQASGEFAHSCHFTSMLYFMIAKAYF